MSQDLLAELIRKGALSLLQFSADEWEDVKNTRNGTFRFSLTFDHEAARSGKKNRLVLIAVASSQFSDPLFDNEDAPELYLGVVSSIATVSTFSSRVVFSSGEKIRPSSLELLLDGISESKFRGAITTLKKRDENMLRLAQSLPAVLFRPSGPFRRTARY